MLYFEFFIKTLNKSLNSKITYLFKLLEVFKTRIYMLKVPLLFDCIVNLF